MMRVFMEPDSDSPFAEVRSLREADTSNQILETRLRAQIIHMRVHFQVEHILVSGGVPPLQ